jgi:ABC-type histidine transport system ATPase subunit
VPDTVVARVDLLDAESCPLDRADAFARHVTLGRDRTCAAGDPRLVADGMTMLVVTHEMAFARSDADRLVMFEEGAIVEEGTPDKLVADAEHARTRAFLRRIDSSH